MKIFITQNVKKGNHIIIDGWSAYDFLDVPYSEYMRHKRINIQGDFGLGLDFTSHMEILFGLLKSKIKGSYHPIPANKLILFIRELEFKIKYKSLSFEKKLINFSMHKVK